MQSPGEFINIVFGLEQRRYRERLWQVRITFIVALILLIVGIIAICAGLYVLLLIRNLGESLNVAAGITSSIIGGFSSAVSGLILKFNSGVNRRLDQTARDLLEIARYREFILLTEKRIDQIQDTTEKDRVLVTLARRVQDGPPIPRELDRNQGRVGLVRRFLKFIW